MHLIERPLDEVFDTRMEVEKNPTGAFQAIQGLAYSLEAKGAEFERLTRERDKAVAQSDARVAAAYEDAAACNYSSCGGMGATGRMESVRSASQPTGCHSRPHLRRVHDGR